MRQVTTNTDMFRVHRLGFSMLFLLGFAHARGTLEWVEAGIVAQYCQRLLLCFVSDETAHMSV